MKTEDEGIRAVREVRVKISAEFDNDPVKIVEHYIAEQVKYRDRMLQPDSPQQNISPNNRSRYT
jgi:hypothetical protein